MFSASWSRRAGNVSRPRARRALNHQASDGIEPWLPAKGLDRPEESIHHHGIELRASAAAQFSQSLFRGTALPIGTGGNHSVEGIGNCYNAGTKRNLLPS